MPDITLNVPDAKWPDFRKHFMLTHPNQTNNTAAVLSDDDWIAHRILLFARGAYEKGVRELFDATAQPPIDKDIIT